MKCKIEIKLDIYGSTANQTAIKHRMNEIIGSIKRSYQMEICDSDNKIVYNDWEDPHAINIDGSFRQSIVEE